MCPRNGPAIFGYAPVGFPYQRQGGRPNSIVRTLCHGLRRSLRLLLNVRTLPADRILCFEILKIRIQSPDCGARARRMVRSDPSVPCGSGDLYDPSNGCRGNSHPFPILAIRDLLCGVLPGLVPPSFYRLHSALPPSAGLSQEVPQSRPSQSKEVIFEVRR